MMNTAPSFRFNQIQSNALYQGTTLVVPHKLVLTRTLGCV